MVTYRSRSSGPPKQQLVILAIGRRTSATELALRRVAAQTPAAVQRHPDAAFGVDVQAVGDGALDLDGGQRPPILECARHRVEVEDVDARVGLSMK